MTERPTERPYTEPEIQQRLARDLPHWKLERGALRRSYGTHSFKATLMVVNAIGHLAEAAWHHPDLSVSYASVEVRLMTHTAKGVTAKDFELAAKIEEIIQWRPGKSGGALEGTPSEPRHAYVKYDD